MVVWKTSLNGIFMSTSTWTMIISLVKTIEWYDVV